MSNRATRRPSANEKHAPGPSYVDADRTASPFASTELPHSRAYFRHLRSKLRWGLLIAYITPLVVLSVYFHYQYTKTLREGIDTHLKSIAENQRNTVDLYLQERTANLRGLLGSLEHFDPPLSGAIRTALEELRADSQAFVDVGLFASGGRLVSYAGPFMDLEGRNYAGEDWFRRVLASESNNFISDVYLGFRGKPHFIIAVTREVMGRVWTLRASVDPEEFSEFVGSSHLITEADAFIVNRNGRPQTFTGMLDSDLSVPTPSLRRVDTYVDEIEMGGATYLAAVAPLQKSDWYLVVRTPKARAYAPVRCAEAVVGALMLLTLLIVVAVALRSTQKLVGRLAAADAAQENLQRQLFNAAKLASVGEMAAGVAHEINNPLAIIYEEAGIMQDTLNPEFDLEPDMEDFRERLGAISEATMRGRNITRQLLAFSREDEPDPTDLDINELVRRTLSVKETEFSVSNIDIVTDLADELPAVRADHNQMEQVLLNLLNNARDAIDGGGRVTVQTSHSDEVVRLRVSDNGYGMPPELMEQVFFPFFTTKEIGKGTGLGLSISYGIVKSAGGRIEVKSEVGKGTTFTITLPAGIRTIKQRSIQADRGADG